jgi:chromosome partitioning protein
MSCVISIANQKGGVGKTTSTINISTELALAGKRTLIIDFDPQASASSGIGVSLLEEGSDIYDMFFGKVSLSEIIQQTKVKDLFIAPASQDLVGLEIELGKTPGRELILRTQINLLKETFDYILIDCPPSSGLLSLNALGSADFVLIPLQAEYYALEGLSALMRTIQFVKETFNPGLEILGVFMTMFDSRTNLSVQVESEAKTHFGERFFATRVPRNIKLSESPSHGLPIALYDPLSAGAKAYKSIANELDARVGASRLPRPSASNG